MAKLMVVGWAGQKPSTARYVTVKGKWKHAMLMDREINQALRREMYGKAGAVWDVSTTNKYPVLVATWFRDSYGNEEIRKEVRYN